MKRKTLIILGSAYLVFVAVILLVAFLTKDTQSPAISTNNEAAASEMSSIDVPDSGQSTRTDGESESVHPEQQINESNNLRTETANVTNEEWTKTLGAPEVISGTNTRISVSTAAVSTNRTSTLSSSSSAYPINTPTRTPTTIYSASSTPSPTITPTPQTGWGGAWTVYFQQSDGTYLSGEINFDISGTDLTGTGTINGTNYSFEGRIISGGQNAIGGWNNSSDSGQFDWTLISDNQFAGSRDIDFGLCGSRPGLNPPEPCYIPPLS